MLRRLTNLDNSLLRSEQDNVQARPAVFDPFCGLLMRRLIRFYPWPLPSEWLCLSDLHRLGLLSHKRSIKPREEELVPPLSDASSPDAPNQHLIHKLDPYSPNRDRKRTVDLHSQPLRSGPLSARHF